MIKKSNKKWDVIVAGGGPAGCAAAVASARDGMKTLLVEATGVLGGMGTSGLVPAWTPLTDKNRIIYCGLAEKVIGSARKGMAHLKPSDTDWVAIDCEKLKRTYDDLVVDSGCDVLLNTFLAGVNVGSKGSVDSVVVANKKGLSEIGADIFIDCTGDGDLAAWAGADYRKGSDENGELQPSTLCFILANVDEYALLYGPKLGPTNPDGIIYSILKDSRYHRIRDSHFCYTLVGPGTVGFNAGHMWDVDNTNPENITAAMFEGRKIAQDIRDALAKYRPDAFGNSHLVMTAPLVGARETRRIIGDYVLSVDDYYARRSFHDEIGRNSYFLDIHTDKKEIDKARTNISFLHERFRAYGVGESHGIPYRTLTPHGLRNVLTAGRSISTDRPVNGSIRVMPCALVTGEAAGVAASIAVRNNGGNVHEINTETLRNRLRDYGAYFN